MRDSYWKMLDKFFPWFSIITGGVGLFILIWGLIGSKSDHNRIESLKLSYELRRLKLIRDSAEMQQARLQKQFDNSSTELSLSYDSLINKTLRSDKKINSTKIDLLKFKRYFDFELEKLKDEFVRQKKYQKIDNLDQRLKSLEDVLMENPSKALAVPLLQIQIQNLKDTETKDISDVRATISTIYDQNKWFLGLMFTLVLGMISLAINNFIPKKGQRASRESGNNEVGSIDI